MKKSFLVTSLIAIAILLAVIILGPIVINECYKNNQGYITLWGANEVLSYYGTVISAIGTIVLGIITVIVTSKFTKTSNNIQEEALKMNAYSSVQIEKCFIYDFDNHNDLRILFKANNPFINSISIAAVTAFYGLQGGVIKKDKIEFQNGERNYIINSHNDDSGQFYSFDIPLFKVNPQKLEQLKNEKRIRIELSFKIINTFKVSTSYSGEIMFNREENKNDDTKAYFICTDNFMSIKTIDIRK